MNIWQTIIVLVWCLYSGVALFLGVTHTYKKKNPFGLTPWLNPIGAFVWTDAVVFGIFFFLASLVSLILQNFILFLLVYSIFWLVRSIGEQAYWLHEQFVEKHRNKPATLFLNKFFPGESVYVYNQIFWQCVSIVTVITSVVLFSRLLNR